MIADEDRNALSHARIVEFHKFYSEFQLWLEAGGERFKVTIRIYETSDGRFFFAQSHFMKTPLQDGPFSPTALTHTVPHLALGAGVDSITTYYDDAILQGHAPSAGWFVLNDLF